MTIELLVTLAIFFVALIGLLMGIFLGHQIGWARRHVLAEKELKSERLYSWTAGATDKARGHHDS